MKNDITIDKVIIRPNKNAEPVFLIFPNKEEKNKYLKKEYQFCAASRDAYMTSKPIDNKTKLREFLDKRVAFAVMSGFVQDPKESRYWIYDPNKGDKRLA